MISHASYHSGMNEEWNSHSQNGWLHLNVMLNSIEALEWDLRCLSNEYPLGTIEQ